MFYEFSICIYFSFSIVSKIFRKGKTETSIPEDIVGSLDCILPGDVIQEILLKLPVKPLMQLRLVSKSWNRVLRSQTFISLHLNQSISSKKFSLLFQSPSHPSSHLMNLCTMPYEPFKIHGTVKLPCDYTIVGSCNGLVCMGPTNWANRRYYVFNPATGESRSLEGEHVIPLTNDRPWIVLSGFGYVPETNDYKILRLETEFEDTYVMDCWVYTLSTDSWRKVGASVDFKIQDTDRITVFHNGCLHFSAMQNNNSVIAAFDIRNEVFSVICLPKPHSWITFIHLWKGQLAIALQQWTLFWANEFKQEVWVMKEHCGEESWELKKVVEILNDNGRLIGCGVNGEFFFHNHYKAVLTMAEFDGNGVKVLDEVPGLLVSTVANHVESLVSFGGENAELIDRRDGNEETKRISYIYFVTVAWCLLFSYISGFRFFIFND